LPPTSPPFVSHISYFHEVGVGTAFIRPCFSIRRATGQRDTDPSDSSALRACRAGGGLGGGLGKYTCRCFGQCRRCEFQKCRRCALGLLRSAARPACGFARLCLLGAGGLRPIPLPRVCGCALLCCSSGLVACCLFRCLGCAGVRSLRARGGGLRHFPCSRRDWAWARAGVGFGCSVCCV
jgi:hypothetical protein